MRARGLKMLYGVGNEQCSAKPNLLDGLAAKTKKQIASHCAPGVPEERITVLPFTNILGPKNQGWTEFG
jgi:hypothetical protein